MVAQRLHGKLEPRFESVSRAKVQENNPYSTFPFPVATIYPGIFPGTGEDKRVAQVLEQSATPRLGRNHSHGLESRKKGTVIACAVGCSTL
jgi:hypothetical protein